MPAIASRQLRTAVAVAWAICWLAMGRVAKAADEPATAEATVSEQDLEFFEKSVRPVLVARCYECHAGDGKEPKGGLRLDSRDALLRGGDTGPAVVPGQPDKSLLIDAIRYGEVYQMPPQSRLPPAEVETLTRWVVRGAPWPVAASLPLPKDDRPDVHARRDEHWCWSAVRSSPLPAVHDSSWTLGPIDCFILSRLEEQNLRPADEADRGTLLRRLYFDLIGLPPPVDEVLRFEQDRSPDAWERQVDRLLQSPALGERWARHWMDLVRYAETCGHEFDYPIAQAWRYRDYLVRAFNGDVPYDQLVREHVAGDLLTDARHDPVQGANESILGTGFWFLHEATHAPVDVRGDQAGRIDNQIDVFGKTFLGLTIACARCHDHKFDAISTEDYYALAGVLESSRRQLAELDPGGHVAHAASRVAALRQETDQALQRLADGLVGLAADDMTRGLLAARGVQRQRGPSASAADKETSDDAPDDLTRWVNACDDPELRDSDHPLHAWSPEARRPSSASADDNSTTAGPRPASAESRRFASFDGDTFGDWFVTGEAFGTSPTIGGQRDPQTDAIQLLLPGMAHSGRLSPKLRGVLRSPTFTISHPHIFYRLAGTGCEVRLIVDGYVMHEFSQLLFKELRFPVDTKAGSRLVWHRQSGDLGMYIGHRAYIEILDPGDGWVALDEVVFSNSMQPPDSGSSVSSTDRGSNRDRGDEVLARITAERCRQAIRAWRERSLARDETAIVNWLLRHFANTVDPRLRSVADEIRAQDERVAEVIGALPPPTNVLAMTEGTPLNEHVFIRGNPRVLGREVPRGLPTALAEDGSVVRGSGRREMADQVASARNPLTARVLVNRLWHHLFGRGIVASVDNFGVLGEPPSHPELLDYLATQLVRSGWSIKHVLREIVLSQTYRMSSQPADPRARDVDPTNRWLHAMPVRRLEGEAIRDAMLSVSGRLDQHMGGPSIPVHITSFMQGRGKPTRSGPTDGDGRRSVYIEVRRNFLPPMLVAFDTPIPFSTMGRRNTSNVPAQALILMNDPFVVEQARRWAAETLADAGASTEDRIRGAYLTAFSRRPTPEEVDQSKAFLRAQAELRGLSPDSAANDADVWSDFCHVLFNVKEFVFLP